MLVGEAVPGEQEVARCAPDKEELLARFSRECREIKKEQARIASGQSRGTAAVATGGDEVVRLKKRMRSMEDMYLRRIKELEAKNE